VPRQKPKLTSSRKEIRPLTSDSFGFCFSVLFALLFQGICGTFRVRRSGMGS
jgi:hypothetical protein